MKSTDRFKLRIEEYLFEYAQQDPLFAEQLLKPNKNIEDCSTYILNEVFKTECQGFEDDEVFKMARHYYDEDDLQIGSKIDCKVIINHAVELTAEEIQKAKQKALKNVVSEEEKRLRLKLLKKSENKQSIQPSLF